MDVRTGNTTNANTTATGESKSTALGKDEFVKLLMAQLGNQDPLSPMDSQAFVAQLAQFANVEQLQGANSRLESLLLAQAASNQMSASNFVGRDVTYSSDKISVGDTSETTIRGDLSASAKEVTAVIKDSNGKTVRTMKLGEHASGEFEFTWDGRDDNGNTVAKGEYSVSLTAATADGKNVDVSQRARGRVSGVSFENGYPELLLGSTRIGLSDVVEIHEPTTTTTPTTATP